MAVDYKIYLAENVLSERRVVGVTHTRSILKILTYESRLRIGCSVEL